MEDVIVPVVSTLVLYLDSPSESPSQVIIVWGKELMMLGVPP